MPTCSTSKLPSKYQTGSTGLFYKRYRRPQSCKYDTYRTRARRSVVDETLFGEPLNKQLLARSKSMEAISSLEDTKPIAPVAKVKSFQRPKTALATMRVTGTNRDPEFSSAHYSHSPPPRNSLAPISSSIVISSLDWRAIKEAARVMTSEEKAALAETTAGSPWAVRRRVALPEPPASPDRADLLEESPRDGAFLERARQLREENLEEVRKLNEYILAAKCNTVLDTQVRDKKSRMTELAETERLTEEMVEEERKRAELMSSERSQDISKLCKDYKNKLQQQLEELEADKILQRERKEREIALRKKAEDVLREEEKREKEQKLQQKLQMQEQLRTENEELKRRKKEEEDWHKQNDQRIRELEAKRRQVEEEREKLEKQSKVRREAEITKLASFQERELDLNLAREEMLLQRQREEKEREWRQKQLEAARQSQERQELIKTTRSHQVELKRQSQAENVKADRELWEEQMTAWRDSVEEERRKEEERQQAKTLYLQDLQLQMENNKNYAKAKKAEDLEWASQMELRRRQHQDSVTKVMERKLQQLKAYNIPEKYVRQIEKRFDSMNNSRFTKSYHGKK